MAASFVVPEKRSEFMHRAQELDGMTVAQVELQNISFAQDKKSAVSTFLVELYSMYGSEVSVVRRDFDWVYNDASKIWTLRAESPLNTQKIYSEKP